MDSDIENCYARGEVIGLNNAALNIGGLIGSMTGSSTISYCYSTGKINYKPSASNIGGLVGYVEPSCSASFCYWDSDTSGVNISAVGMIKNTNDMVGVELGFGDPWYIDEYFICNDGYPILSPSPIISFAGGNGSNNSPWLIESAEQLNYLRAYVGVVGESKYFTLTTNIDLGVFPWNVNQGWLPIGTEDNPFKGVFNGNGKKIENLYTEREKNHVGLFGCISGALIKDLSLERFDIKADDCVGALVGKSVFSTIKGISAVRIKIEGTGAIGGLAGLISGAHSGEGSVAVVNCLVDNSLDGYGGENYYIGTPKHSSATNKKSIGGLAGSASGCVINNSVIKSYVKGSEHVGGVVGCGESSLRINYCDTYGQIEGVKNIGGIVGKLIGVESGIQSKVMKCSSFCEILGETSSATNIGGIAGILMDGAIVEYCEAYNCISAQSATNIGGIAGILMDKAIVEYCEAYNYISAQGSYNNSTVGGIAGLVFSGSEVLNCLAEVVFEKANLLGGIAGFVNNGYVRMSYSYSTLDGNDKVGGIAGKLKHGKIIKCYASGEVKGKLRVGGIVGYIKNTSIQDHYNIVEECYSIATISGSQGSSGGLIGTMDYSYKIFITNCYWDTVTSQKTNTAQGKGEGIMTVDMVRDSTKYAGWDFDNTWAMEDYTTYPYLKWQDEPGVHNYPKHGHHKVYKGRTVYWESFPVMDDDEVDFAEILEPLTYIEALNKVYTQDGATKIWQHGQWNGELTFKKTDGYKLEFIDDEEYELIVPGTGVDYDNTTVTLKPKPNENWVGYWIPQPQKVADVFGKPEFDYVEKVSGEGWTISRSNPGDSWGILAYSWHLSFGKMYEIVIFSDDDEEFYWPLPTEPYYPPDPIIPQNFVFMDGPDYEVFNIESIDNDQDVIEVGVFAGNTCVGASVFTGEYPLQILAYTNASHSEEVISFAVHRSARGEDSNVRTVELLDPETGEYYEESLQPQAKRIATLRLGADDEIEEVIKPQFTLSQNYPNPIVMSQVSRSSELTKIDFSLPEAAEVSLNIYNIKGQLVKTLASGELSAGRHTVSWDGNNVNNQSVGSGVYFYRLDNGKKTINRKMLIIK